MGRVGGRLDRAISLTGFGFSQVEVYGRVEKSAI